MKRRNEILFWVLLALSVAVSVLCLVPGFSFTSDGRADSLLKETLPRLTVGAFVFFVYLLSPYCVHGRLWGRKHAYLWCLPCLLVALANFPFSALITGSARIVRPALLPLLLVRCLAVGVLEEASFRGMLYPWLRARCSGRRWGVLIAILVSSAVFALLHLFNLAFGAGVGETFLQVGYTFLLGCMFAAVYERTQRVLPCIVLHALFDFGGGISVLGIGVFQDVCFWVLTAVCGALCLVHVLAYLFRRK